ncbi:Bifunctional polynucleotide phosphatase kinase [Dirofilaria immitis]|nr:Bifunctional polynucleotide phosphatase kinase [Dirofilaria immitis]
MSSLLSLAVGSVFFIVSRILGRFTETDRKDGESEKYVRWRNVGKDLIILDFGDINHCANVAGFDFDGTVVVTKSGKTFPEDEYDWKFSVIPYHKYWPKLPEETGSQDRDAFCRKMEKVCQQIRLPIQVFVSLGTLRYRKPYIGMWNYFESHGNGGISINRESSFYVGDAAGRIQTNQVEVEDYTLPSFSPSPSMDEKISLFEPENTPVPGNGLEVLIFVGYPGCGKSTLAHKLASEYGYGIVNRDTLKTKRYISLAKSCGAALRCFLFNCTLEQAAHNCKYRAIVDTSEKHLEIGRMEPKLSEGFSSIVKVNFVPEFDCYEHEAIYRMYLCDS